MMHKRRLSAAVLAAGIVVGTITDVQPARVVPRVADYWILSGDFHVHAAWGDGTLLPWDLRREMQRAGLDVIAVTNHNTTFAARFAHWWAASTGPAPIVLAGQEITAPDYHIAAVGVRETVSRHQSAASAIEAVHAQGGVAIAAHPDRSFWRGYDDRALTLLDGTEVANSPHPLDVADYQTFLRRLREYSRDAAAIASSDFHGWDSLGRCRTYLFVREQSETGVLEAIRAGRTVAEDEAGRLYGDPALIRAVEENKPAGRVDPTASWRRISVACAWVGVLGLVLFGRRP